MIRNNPFHEYTNGEVIKFWDPEFNVWGFEIKKIPTNIKLENQIKAVENQARSNYETTN